MTTERSVTSTRRVRPQLDRDTIIDAVLRLAARPGTRAVTVRRLGRELGADPTAIYRHYADKDALLRDAIDRLYGQVHASVPADADWRTRLRLIAVGALEALLAHPALGAQAATLTTGGPNELAVVELMLGGFSDAGLDDAETVRYYATLSSYVLAFAAAQAGARLDPDSAGAYGTEWVADYRTADLAQAPKVAALQPALHRLQDREVFLTGLDILLESAAARAAVSDSRTTGSAGR